MTRNSTRLIVKLMLACLVSATALTVAGRPSADEAIAEILAAADQRNAGHPAIQSGLVSNQLNVQKQAILALGRIGEANSVKSLAAFLYSPQPEVRSLTAYAIGITGTKAALPALINRLKSEQSVPVINELLPAIGLIGPDEKSPDIIAVILAYLDHKEPGVVAASCDALNYAWSMHRATISVPNSTQVFKLLSLAAENSEVANHCLYALTRIRTEAALFDEARMLETAAKLTTDYQHQLMTMIAGTQKRLAFTDYFASHLNNTSSADLKALAAQALASLPASEATDQIIARLIAGKAPYLQHDYVRIGLLDGLGQQQPDARITDFLKQLSKDDSEWVSSRATAMLFASEPGVYLAAMTELLKSDRVTTQSTVLTIANAIEGEPKQQLLKAAAESQFTGIRDYARQLQAEAPSQSDTPNSATLPFTEIKAVISKRMLIKTTKGDVVIQLLPSTPYTSFNFYQLANKGFYNNTEFHRVIPSFVVQGGDINGEVRNGPGYQIREELYPISHLQGTVGMASAGKDTAGAGFYFNLKDNYHLDRRYTVFARVVSGFDVVQKLGIGDAIISVTEFQAP